MSTLTVRCRLAPTPEQDNILRETVGVFAAACNEILHVARREGEWRNFELHKHCYYDVRARYGLSANLVVRAIARVGKKNGWKAKAFKPTSVDYDKRILSLASGEEALSLSTIAGRENVAMRLGAYQRAMLALGDGVQAGQLVLDKRGRWYMHLQIRTSDEDVYDPIGFLGVDLGVTNVASDSDGNIWTTEKIETVRQRFARLRAALQKAGTNSAKRHLKRLARKEACFRRDVNHQISKRLVAKAKRTARGVKLEELTHIRARTRVRKSQRAKHAGWSFNQLRQFVEYKARRNGVPLGVVKPAYTSQTCSCCGHRDKRNRKGEHFECHSCGVGMHADVNAAVNISRAAVSQPIVGLIS